MQIVNKVLSESNDPIQTIEDIRSYLHSVSPLRTQPVNSVKWVKIEEVTLSLLRKRPGNPEPAAEPRFRGIVPVAARGTEAPVRGAVPGTAPQDALLTITSTRTQPCTPINWGVFVGPMPAVF